MHIKSMIAAAAITAFAGTAFAQTTGATQPTQPSWTAEEQAMYAEREQLFEGFFMDETFAELRSPEEMEMAWSGMTAADQEELRVSCVEVQTNPQVYSQSLQDFCGQVEQY